MSTFFLVHEDNTGALYDGPEMFDSESEAREFLAERWGEQPQYAGHTIVLYRADRADVVREFEG